LNSCDLIAGGGNDVSLVVVVVPFFEAEKAELSSAASAGHMTTSSFIGDEQATFWTCSNTGTALNAAGHDRLFRSSLQDFDSWVLSIALFVPAAFYTIAFPLLMAGPAEIVGSANTVTTHRTPQTYIARFAWDAPGLTPGTLLVAKPLSDVILRNLLLDFVSRFIVEASHVAHQVKLPDSFASRSRARKGIPALLYSVETVLFH